MTRFPLDVGAGFALAAVAFAAACDVPCPEGQVRTESACVDVGFDEPEPEPSEEVDSPTVPAQHLVALEWTVDVAPNDNRVVLSCGGRDYVDKASFPSPDTFREEFSLTAGESCTVTVSDARGGLLPSGRAFACSREVASWGSERAVGDVVVAEFDVEACVPGCVDPEAENHASGANLDDGSCTYLEGCTDERALNFDPTATKNDGSCDFGGIGLVEITISTDDFPGETGVSMLCGGYEAFRRASYPSSNTDFTDKIAVDAGFDCKLNLSDTLGDSVPPGSVVVCGEEVASWNVIPGDFNPFIEEVATFFVSACSGCMDASASNFDADAHVDDGTCTY